MGKADDVFEGPLLKKAIDKRAVEDVAGAGGVDNGNFEGSGFQQAAVIQKYGAFRTACNTDDRAAVSIRELVRIISRKSELAIR